MLVLTALLLIPFFFLKNSIHRMCVKRFCQSSWSWKHPKLRQRKTAFKLFDQSSGPTFEPTNQRNYGWGGKGWGGEVGELLTGRKAGAVVSGIQGGSFRTSGLVLQPPWWTTVMSPRVQMGFSGQLGDSWWRLARPHALWSLKEYSTQLDCCTDVEVGSISIAGLEAYRNCNCC